LKDIATSSKKTEFLSNLAEECSTLRAFVSLLEDEQRSLLSQHSDELLQIAETKTQLANKISRLSEAQRLSLPQEPKNIAHWLQHNLPQAFIPWQESLKLAENVQRLNKTNGELIQIKLRYNQQALGVLYGSAQSTAGLYGSNGKPNQFTASRALGSV